MEVRRVWGLSFPARIVLVVVGLLALVLLLDVRVKLLVLGHHRGDVLTVQNDECTRMKQLELVSRAIECPGRFGMITVTLTRDP